jgi:hypothetical protein
VGALRIAFLYTNIGRGHPFYLDGIRARLNPAVEPGVRDVFALAAGASRLAWRAARAAYTLGSSGGGANNWYSRLRARTDFNRDGTMLRLLGAPLRATYADDPALLVVAHPLLAGIFRDHDRLVYQHGELAVPREALVRAKHTVLVPDAGTADSFRHAGAAGRAIHVTGLNIDPLLQPLAAAAFAARVDRLRGTARLTAACFSSGAEPPAHVAALCRAAAALGAAGWRVHAFARRDGRFARRLSAHLQSAGVPWADADGTGADAADANVCIWPYGSRLELDQLTAATFPEFDVFLAPAHERSHWALGLGLPLLVVAPSIGSYAPLNQLRLLDAQVALTIPPDVSGVVDLLAERHRDGMLVRMAERGWEHHPIDGFDRAAAIIRELARGTDPVKCPGSTS